MAGLIVWALAAGFVRVGAAPVYVLNEAREGVYARAMLDSGNFVLPHVPNHVENGETIPDKPPLVHWLSAAVTAIRVWIVDGRLPSGPALAARYDEWSLRFPSALAATVTVAAIVVLGRRIIGERASMFAGAMLLASSQFVEQARFGRVDMVLCCCITLAMLLAGRVLLDEKPRILLLAAVAAAFATLAKGPLGTALPVAACTAFVVAGSLREGSLHRWRRLPWGQALVVWVLVALPWYLAAYIEGGTAPMRSQIFGETLEQFIGGNSRMSALYYVKPWLIGSAPWNLFALLGVGRAWRRRDARAGFCALWWGVFLIVFELSAYKRRAYLLPTLPPCALLAGYWIDGWLTDRRSSLRASLATAVPTWGRSLAFGCVAAAAAGAAVAHGGLIKRWIGTPLPPVDGALAFGGTALGAAAFVLFFQAARHRQLAAAFACLSVAQGAIFLGPLAVEMQLVAQRHSPVPLVRRMVTDLPPGETVTVVGLGDDPSLLVLMYFPDLAHVVVVPERDGLQAVLAPGRYLLSDVVWAQVTAVDGVRWRRLWTDTLRERDTMVPVVFAEHRLLFSAD